QKRKDEICPFSSLAFFQPTTVDKEPLFFNPLQLTKSPFYLILFENLFKPRQLYLQPQNSVLSNLRLAA
ncbi:TPA: hypothetical protein ACJY1Q_002117, partial [Streptococcus pneumoniae]